MMSEAQTLEPMDRVVLGQCPMVMAPIHGDLVGCEPGQRRLVAAEDGVWVEARTEGIHFRGRLACVPMPYGRIDGFCRLAGGMIPAAMREEIFSRARETAEEVACVVVWSRSARQYCLIWPDVGSASAGHITYSSWADTDDLSLVVDIHSHGFGAAYFSRIDDESDRGIYEPHLSVVLGRCDQPEFEIATRFCVGHYLIDLPAPPF
jgi:PRTRC genetic system protein A